jgi:hypothetical protein
VFGPSPKRRKLRLSALGNSQAILLLPSWQHPLLKVGFEMPIDDHRIPIGGGDVSPLYISWLLFFDAESRFFHISYFCAI